MNKLCRRLVQCPSLLELDFSHGSLKDEAIENLLKILPKMKSLQLLNMSHVQMSTDGALLLVRSLIDCHRVRAVELQYVWLRMLRSQLIHVVHKCGFI
ncbi:unnamed protein product [Oncorhynchus mykiss]|uniref:Uncharacterized protein n=1 Tax=Oncorhynchus mykiss TaxID=8022 RepID=A0A060XEU9_ONCMY|nr:unnamed protein product [Oncorhynchus mykiss]